jgi:hypothetical protein
MSVITYKSHSVNLTTLPPASVLALASRGLTRLLGSEVSSKVIAHFADTPDADDAAKEAFAESVRLEFLSHLATGTLGEGRGGPRKDPVEAEMTSIATREVRETLKTHGLKFIRPAKGEEKFEPYVAFGNGDKRTLDQMVSKRLADHADRLRKAAEKAINEAKRQVAKPTSEAAVASADDLGL